MVHEHDVAKVLRSNSREAGSRRSWLCLLADLTVLDYAIIKTVDAFWQVQLVCSAFELRRAHVIVLQTGRRGARPSKFNSLSGRTSSSPCGGRGGSGAPSAGTSAGTGGGTAAPGSAPFSSCPFAGCGGAGSAAISVAVHSVRESLTAHQTSLGNCWQHEAAYPCALMPWPSGRSP